MAPQPVSFGPGLILPDMQVLSDVSSTTPVETPSVAGATQRTTEGASTAIRQLRSLGDVQVGAVRSTLLPLFETLLPLFEPHATNRPLANTSPMHDDVFFMMLSLVSLSAR